MEPDLTDKTQTACSDTYQNLIDLPRPLIWVTERANPNGFAHSVFIVGYVPLGCLFKTKSLIEL